MDINKLILLSKNKPDTNINEFKIRCKEREKLFVDKEKLHRCKSEWYERVYVI
jgi:hypothetical protein